MNHQIARAPGPVEKITLDLTGPEAVVTLMSLANAPRIQKYGADSGEVCNALIAVLTEAGLLTDEGAPAYTPKLVQTTEPKPE
jgi:hypothetical protein